ncbi:TPA: glycosyltransferase family 1 protein [Streptococcus suis]
MDNKIKVAMVTNHLGVMGISAVIMNYSRALNSEKFEITIVAGTPIANQYIEECKDLGITIIELPSRKHETKKHYFEMFKVFRREKFDIVHIHGNSSLMAIELTLARLSGIKTRIAHSHNSTCTNFLIHKLINPYFNRMYTKSLSCGILAGEWLFGENNFEVLPNSFCTEKFKFDSAERKKVREKLGIDNKFVIGHIGRFNEQKNQAYLLRVFEKLASAYSDIYLLLVGTGPNFEKIKAIVETNDYKDRIILYGNSEKPSKMYSAMDIFMLPSLYEGLPVVLIEAQISGLPCIVSDSVTREMDFGGISWQSIKSDPQIWADAVVDLRKKININRENYYLENRNQIFEYDIEKSVKHLEEIYIKINI